MTYGINIHKEINLKFLLSGLILLALPLVGFGQAGDEDHHHDHSTKNELSLGAGLVYEPLEQLITSGFNLHYIRMLGETGRFGVGVSLETILDEHRHIFLAVVGQVKVYEGLKFSYSPGILLKNEALAGTYQFAQHIEITYEFDIGKMHVGPVIGVGQAKDDWHFLGGIHAGIDF